MTHSAKIYQFPHRMREVPAQEIRSIYEDLYLEQTRKQSMEQVIMKLHERMNPEPEFNYRLWWMIVMPFWGFIAFMIGFYVGKL